MVLGNNLRVYREARREGLKQVARAVGMDHAQLSKLERGLAGCSDGRKLRLARYYGVSVTRLFFVEDGDILSPERPSGEAPQAKAAVS